MCVLSNVDILQEVQQGHLVLSDFDPRRIKSNGYDWRLGNTILIANRYRVDDWIERYVEYGDRFEFRPGEFYLCTTLDRIELPSNVMAMMTGRSSLGRRGWVCHKTAAHFDSGFHGYGTAEVEVQGPWPVSVRVGQRVGQFIFEYLRTPTTQPYNNMASSKYRDQPAVPVPSRLELDDD